jgi:hypothetical protein
MAAASSAALLVRADDSYKEEHFGPKATDKFTVVRSADGRLISSDRPEPPAPKSVWQKKKLA